MKTEKRILAEKICIKLHNHKENDIIWTLLKLTKEDLEFLIMACNL